MAKILCEAPPHEYTGAQFDAPADTILPGEVFRNPPASVGPGSIFHAFSGADQEADRIPFEMDHVITEAESIFYGILKSNDSLVTDAETGTGAAVFYVGSPVYWNLDEAEPKNDPGDGVVYIGTAKTPKSADDSEFRLIFDGSDPGRIVA